MWAFFLLLYPCLTSMVERGMDAVVRHELYLQQMPFFSFSPDLDVCEQLSPFPRGTSRECARNKPRKSFVSAMRRWATSAGKLPDRKYI